ncbi:MAG: hypothetical protein H6760_04335 [Candidatus Nomurabacteria bacterium]|nr:MAG: hypothetical protein H6760_04335 [Candidatus Nomurabacteria bacterium]
MYGKLQKIQIAILIAVFVTVLSFPARPVFAANLTSISDTLSSLTQNTAANHEIYFITSVGVDADADYYRFDFANFGFSTLDYTDIDLAVDDDGGCDGSWTEKTLASSDAAGVWGVSVNQLSSEYIIFDAPTDATSGEIPAGRCVQIQIGTNASGGNAQLVNPNDTNTHVVDIFGNLGAIDDFGKFALDFVADDSVNVTATVDPSITFAISDTTVGFGTLSSSAARYATSDGNGTGTNSSPAHNLTVSTNATSGYAITYYGATLTSGSDTISPATISNDGNGTPGTEQFALSADKSDDAVITSGYQWNSTLPSLSDWNFVASTVTEFVSETGPTNAESIFVHYIANIASITEAGLYQTDITYIATAVF